MLHTCLLYIHLPRWTRPERNQENVSLLHVKSYPGAWITAITHIFSWAFYQFLHSILAHLCFNISEHARLHRRGAIGRASRWPLAVGAEVKKNILGHLVLTPPLWKRLLERRVRDHESQRTGLSCGRFWINNQNWQHRVRVDGKCYTWHTETL